MADIPDHLRSPVTSQHFMAFGAIVHLFARHESLMLGINSRLLGCNVGYMAMFMAELPYRGKRDTTLAIIKLRLPETQVEKISGYLGELHQWSKLRNSIAHSLWVEGARPGSIKPFSMSVRGGVATPIGVDTEERDYTAKELIDIANRLMVLRTKFADYLETVGLGPPKEIKDAISESTEVPGGTPSAK